MNVAPIARAVAAASFLALAVPRAMAQDAPSAPAAAPVEKAWKFDVSAYTYWIPDEDVFVSPVVKVDHGALHLEARYNYEGKHTASVWVGYNFSVGEKLTLDFTGMFAGVFGDTSGVAPGWRFSLKYGMCDLASESEYLIDSEDSANNFFYNWSELGFAPADWIRGGLAVQRTRLYGETERSLQRGFFLGFSYKKVWASGYLFNPDLSKPTFVLALGAAF
jgi:hypothetical protein